MNYQHHYRDTIDFLHTLYLQAFIQWCHVLLLFRLTGLKVERLLILRCIHLHLLHLIKAQNSFVFVILLSEIVGKHILIPNYFLHSYLNNLTSENVKVLEVNFPFFAYFVKDQRTRISSFITMIHWSLPFLDACNYLPFPCIPSNAS